ncbi:HAD family hydrolase [Clostridium cuniculi]|uniref:HAD family hydrolase n=1 Tax=Clostridium cuniculi TaxID=2548455 RepID=UPI001055FBA1|nr:HAD family hydrolase [Clostridium cuniculi]
MELFVTDLDGTLINSKREVPKRSLEILNKLIERGVNFTVATARTPATAVEILQNLNLKLPVALMNGVLIYDTKELKYIDIKGIEKEAVNKVLDIFKTHKKSPLVYGVKDNHLWVYHKEFENVYEYNFYKERVDKKLKTFVKVEDYNGSLRDSNIINFVAFDNYEKIKAIAEEIKSIEGITVNYYKDVYEDCYFLEAYSSEASKANGIKYLSKYIGYSKVICFGDNLNDIPMFELADEAYATANAAEEIKKIATDVIGSCEENGVAEFLENRFKNK